MKLMGLVLLLVFYAVYLGKMLLQRRKGIQTDQMARGKAKGRLFYTELVMKAATLLVVAAEAASILLVTPPVSAATILGALLALLGDAIFAAAVVTMRDSWRAGIAAHDQTDLITRGVYSVSRNPAFLAFDCVYVGILMMFFNWPLLLCSLFAMVMLHLQILQEEQHLLRAFGQDYAEYRRTVCRYLGRRSGL